MPRILIAWLAALVLLTGCSDDPSTRTPLVLAPVSLQESLNHAADQWAAQGHQRPILSFAASPALARQIDNGARADLFISADPQWMDHVEGSGRIRPGSRQNLVGNRLVLVAPNDGLRALPLEPSAIERALGRGRLAMADPDSVPAGRYGKAALLSLGLWTQLEHRLAGAENVRAALALAERGEVPLALVYATDGKASGRVRIVSRFPELSHPPILYPIALLADSGPEAEAFYQFLLSKPGQAIFESHNFIRPGEMEGGGDDDQPD